MNKSDERKFLFNEFQPIGKKAWKEQILRELKAVTEAEKQALYEQKMVWRPEENITIQPFYTREDLSSLPLPLLLNQKNNWKYREYILVQDEKTANQLALEALQKGADSLCFNLSQRSVSTFNFSALLQGIKTADTPVSFLINDLPEEFITPLQKIAPYQWKGSFNFDPVNNVVLGNNLAENSFNKLADAINCTADFSDFYALTVNSHHLHEAGASIVQELAFVIAAFIEYADQLTERGVPIAAIFNSTEFSVSLSSNYFMEMAKCRALRVLVAKLAEAYQVSSFQLSVHAQTASWNKSAKDPYNNMIRTTIEAMAAVFGGCNALTVMPVDENREENLVRRIGRNISTILKEESYLNKVVDIAAGSYYIENLTYMLAQEAWNLFQIIEAKGGFMKAYQSGFIAAQINQSRMQKESALQNGNQVLVGINKYVLAEVENTNKAYFRKLPGV